MIGVFRKIYRHIEGMRIWNAKISENLRIRITSSEREQIFVRPNMNNLRGKRGRAVLNEIRSMKPVPTDDIKRKADECMNKIFEKRKEREIMKKGLIKNVETKMKTDEIKDGQTKYVSAIQGHWFECYMTKDEVEASVEYAIRLMEALRKVNSSGLNQERLEELQSQVNDKHSAAYDAGIRHAILGHELITDEVNELVEEIADMRRVGGAYWLIMARPSFMSVIYAVYDRIVDQFDDEDLYIQSTYFLLRGILMIHSNEIEDADNVEK